MQACLGAICVPNAICCTARSVVARGAAMSVSESDVGISRYTNSLPGFTGILKHR